MASLVLNKQQNAIADWVQLEEQVSSPMSWAPPSPVHVTSEERRDVKHYADRAEEEEDQAQEEIQAEEYQTAPKEDRGQIMPTPSSSQTHARKRSLEPSPRIRKRLDDAKEHATLFRPVWEQSEVIQWLSACNCQLIELGRRLEAKGFHSLHSIAFLTEEDLMNEAPWLESAVRTQLLQNLARLRHELFRI